MSTLPPIELRRVLGHFPSGVVVVTAVLDGTPAGFAASAFSSVSLDPPLVGFFVGRQSVTWPRIRPLGRFGVNILADSQGDLCRRFATRDENKFAGVDWRPGTSGVPLLAGAAAFLECRLHDVLPAGDHELALGEITDLGDVPGQSALVSFRGDLHSVGAPS